MTAERPLVAVLGKMHLVDGGPTRFISTIWQPLHDAMARLLPPHGNQRQFLTVILSYELAAARQRDPKFDVPWKPNGQPDYRNPMVLDAL